MSTKHSKSIRKHNEFMNNHHPNTSIVQKNSTHTTKNKRSKRSVKRYHNRAVPVDEPTQRNTGVSINSSSNNDIINNYDTISLLDYNDELIIHESDNDENIIDINELLASTKHCRPSDIDTESNSSDHIDEQFYTIDDNINHHNTTNKSILHTIDTTINDTTINDTDNDDNRSIRHSYVLLKHTMPDGTKQLSTFPLNDTTRIISNESGKKYVLHMDSNETIVFVGAVHVTVNAGSIDVNGSIVSTDNSIDIYSSRVHPASLTYIQSLNDHTIIELDEVHNARQQVSTIELPLNDTAIQLYGMTPLTSSTYDIKKQCYNYSRLNIPEEWKLFVQSVIDSTDIYIPRIMACGAKSTGKTTLLRYTVNRLLSYHQCVAWLDCDISTTHHTTYTTLTLSIYSTPLHNCISQQYGNVVKQYNHGSTQLYNHPQRYLQQIKSLYQIYSQQYSELPLVINTYGWIKGLGFNILNQLIDITDVTHIGQLSSNNGSIELSYNAMNTVCTLLPAYAADSTAPKQLLNAEQYNTLMLTQYFQQLAADSTLPINELLYHTVPYTVPYNSIQIEFIGVNRPSNDYMYHTINGRLITLCTDNMYYNIIGYGIVYSIDMKKQLMYIVTPLAHDKLHSVQYIVCGDLYLPQSFYTTNINTTSIIPYMSTNDSSIGSVAGGSKLSKRRNLVRKRLM